MYAIVYTVMTKGVWNDYRKRYNKGDTIYSNCESVFLMIGESLLRSNNSRRPKPLEMAKHRFQIASYCTI